MQFPITDLQQYSGKMQQKDSFAISIIFTRL